MNELFSM